MNRLLGLAFAVTVAASPLASAQPRRAPRVAPPTVAAAPAAAAPAAATPAVAPAATPATTTPAPVEAQPAPGLCCCRAWAHGWQYSWRDAAACTSANGTCVSPDHC